MILGDWGTTTLRLWLCRVGADGTAHEVAAAEGPGARAVEDFAAAFSRCAARLPRQGETADALLCGMVGSNIGWRETGYIACPAPWRALVERAESFTSGGRQIRILPGVACAGRCGYPEVMRGEEAQLLGLARRALPDGDKRLACLPGTHTKWAVFDREGIASFATSVEGELFDLLSRHSVLAAGVGPGVADIDRDVFEDAVDLLRLHPELGLAEALFSARGRAATGELAPHATSSWLSGLLVGAQVRDVGLTMQAAAGMALPVLLAGEEALTDLYAAAMARYGLASDRHPGRACSIGGLAACHAWSREARA